MKSIVCGFLQRWPRLSSWSLDLGFTLICANLVAATLGIAFLNSDNSPTGGDAASHLLYAKLYADELLFSGQILPWVPEVFSGMPFLSYYFPLPFIVIACLAKGIGLSAAFKWGGFLAAMLLPGAVFSASRRWLGFAWPAALCAGLGAFAFLMHEQNSIWGGNLLSTLSGEFAYSYGVFFAVLAMMAWARAITLGRGWLLAAAMEAASGFSHGFPLLVVGFSSAFLLLDGAASSNRTQNWQRFKQSFSLLLRGHTLAFALLGGWLWPMLEMHGLTIPNDGSFPTSGWRDLFPETLWPILGAGVFGLLCLILPTVRQHWGAKQRTALCYFISAAGLAAVAYLAGDQLGLADIRFFPLVWLLGAISCGWLAGQALHSFAQLPAFQPFRCLSVASLSLCAVAASLALLAWTAPLVKMAPDWGLWNHSGLEAKPQWRNLSTLFPAMQGDLWSPRLAFEHDPANNDLGSTRSLEALPIFLNHRPVLEGLYMESGLLGPAIYQLQSEISAQPSSPLVRFPSGSLDPEFAAKHLNFLHADTLLIRSERAKQALEASGLFQKTAESPPFALYQLKRFDSHLAQVVTTPMRILPMQGEWMQEAFAWFRTRSRFDSYLPVFVKGGVTFPSMQEAITGAAPPVREVSLARNELVFETTAIGRPHLIKMAYHPRWQLATQGTLAVAGPGFMLVVPQEKEIRLVYGHTLVGKLGMLGTSAAFIIALLLLWKYRRPATTPSVATAVNWRYWPPLLAGWFFLIAAGAYYATYSPERIYKEAWEFFNANDDAKASEQFLLAYQLRRPPAKKEESLFWMAKSLERGGKRAEAKAAYRRIFEQYHGYWVPESLYTYIVLERLDGHDKETAALVQRLREEYPNNPWTLRLNEAK